MLARKSALFVGVLVAILTAFPAAQAQVATGTISGVVSDKTGGVLPGVALKVINQGTGAERTAVSDDGGRYRLTSLAPGAYQVQAELTGFRTTVRRDLTLSVGREIVVDLVLEVGEMTEQIEVSGEAPVVERTTATIEQLVDEQKIRDLPLNKRSFEELVFLQPMVSRLPAAQADAQKGFTAKITAAGSRMDQNNFLLDGTDMTHMFFGQTPGSVAGVLMGVETIKEFQVVTTNYSAEFGKISGVLINAVTKAGTNDFHGSIFEFHRNDNLDARNFFDRGAAPEFKRNQFGFTLGGPIVENRTFFFGSYEALRERLGTTRVAQVPNRLARQGTIPDPATGQLVNVGVAPQVKPFLDLFPEPNGRDFGAGIAEFLSNPTDRTEEDYLQARVDHQFSDADSMFVRYTFDDASRFVPKDLPNHGANIQSRNQYLTIQEKHIFSPSVLNVFQFGFSRNNPQSFPVTPAFPSGLGIDQFIRGGKYPGLLGNLRISPLLPTFLGANNVDIFRFPENLFEYSDDVTVSKGRHDLRFGGLVKRYQHNWTLDFFFQGQVTFVNLRDFLQARPFNFLGALPGSNATSYYRETLYGFYAQDNFKIRPNLTLNLGLRYEFVADRNEINNKYSKFINPLSDPQTTTGLPVFESNPSLKNWAPRIGLAWDPFSDGKTAIRAGFGIYHEQILAQMWGSGPIFMTPFVNVAFILSPNFPDILAGSRPLILPFLLPVDHFSQQPYMLKYSFDIQRELVKDAVLQIGYVGSRGIKLFRGSDVNIPQAENVNGRLTIPRLVRPNPRFGEVLLMTSDASSFYNALVISLNKRLSGGLQVQASYTVAKSVDDASGYGGGNFKTETASRVYYGRQRELNRGLSNFDMRQSFNLNYTYDLPFGPGRRFGGVLTGVAGKFLEGWQIAGVTRISSGVPFTALLGFDRSNLANTDNVRPDLKPGADNNPVLGGPDRYFDPGSFVLQPPGVIGNAGRNTLIGPGLVNFDFTLVKATSVSAISEDFKIQFRAEFFNILNRPNFGLPIGRIFTDPSGIASPNAGRITETVTTSRQIQFGIRILF